MDLASAESHVWEDLAVWSGQDKRIKEKEKIKINGGM